MARNPKGACAISQYADQVHLEFIIHWRKGQPPANVTHSASMSCRFFNLRRASF
jgi:hypothetical protein